MDDDLTLLAAIQDALKTGLVTELGDDATVDLGFPVELLQRHVWIEGSADIDHDYDLSNGAQSGVVVSLTVDGIVQFADVDYDATRDQIRALFDAVTTVATALVGSVVDHVAFGRTRFVEGKSATGLRQFGFYRDIEFTTWLG